MYAICSVDSFLELLLLELELLDFPIQNVSYTFVSIVCIFWFQPSKVLYYGIRAQVQQQSYCR